MLEALLASGDEKISARRISNIERDLYIIGLALAIEHLELASYKFLVTAARMQGLKKVSSQAEKNMGEEENAAQELEDLIESIIQG